MIANTKKQTAFGEEVVAFCRNARSKNVRTIREFACEEVVLPMDGGPHEGEHFDTDKQPFAGLILDALSEREYGEYYITGPSQSGKTLISFVVPIAYHAVELRKNLVCAVPDMNMADNKWQIDLKPVFDESPALRYVLPTSGPGSKGGKVKDTIKLDNGAVIKFMSPFGDDANRAGFTASTVCVTEAARFSAASETSVESDPLRQLKARQRSRSRFTESGELNIDRVMIVEGTVTLADELPWIAKENSTDTRIACPCPHCGDHVTPERDDLIGWKDAATELEAARNAFFCCPSCGEKLSNDDRIEMNRKAILLHKGQKVDKRGRVRGKPTETVKFWIRWNAFNNLFTSAADLGLEEWNAAQFEEDTAERINAEKDLCQSIWCVPYEPDNQIDATPLDRKAIVSRFGDKRYNVGVLPEDTVKLTAGIDVGRWQCWYFLIAWRADGRLHCPLYGAQDTSLNRADGVTPELESSAIIGALNELYDRLERGLPVEGDSRLITPDAVFIDSNYMTESVVAFCHSVNETGRMSFKSRYVPIIGRGQTQRDRYQYSKPSKTGAEIRRIGNGWHLAYERGRRCWRVTLDADNAKLAVQDALRVDSKQPGALALYDATKSDHMRVARHLSSEIRTTTLDPTRGIVTEWKKSGANHLLDCAGYGFIAGDYSGFKATKLEAEPDEKPKKEKGAKGWLSRVAK